MHREETCGCQGRGGVERDQLGVWVSRCKLLHLERKNNKALLYSTGNYIQYPGVDHDKNITKNKIIFLKICIFITESLCYTAEIGTTL